MVDLFLAVQDDIMVDLFLAVQDAIIVDLDHAAQDVVDLSRIVHEVADLCHIVKGIHTDRSIIAVHLLHHWTIQDLAADLDLVVFLVGDNKNKNLLKNTACILE